MEADDLTAKSEPGGREGPCENDVGTPPPSSPLQCASDRPDLIYDNTLPTGSVGDMVIAASETCWRTLGRGIRGWSA